MDDELGKIHIVGSVTISYGRMYMHRKCILIILSYKHSMLMFEPVYTKIIEYSFSIRYEESYQERKGARVRPPMAAYLLANVDACCPQSCIV